MTNWLCLLFVLIAAQVISTLITSEIVCTKQYSKHLMKMNREMLEEELEELLEKEDNESLTSKE